MSFAHLYLTPLRLYAVAPDGQVSRTDVGESADAMDAALAEAVAWLRSKTGFGAQVELLLASSLVRFVSVPWIAGTFTGAAIRRQVEQSLAEGGENSGDWRLRIQWPRYGWPTFAVGYPSRLLAATGETLQKAGLKADRTTATAVAVVSRYGQYLPKEEAFVGFQEEDGLTGVHLQKGGIAEVECIPHAERGLDAADVWGNRKRFEFPEDGQLRWLQAAHCPSAFSGTALTADGCGSDCVATDLIMAIR